MHASHRIRNRAAPDPAIYRHFPRRPPPPVDTEVDGQLTRPAIPPPPTGTVTASITDVDFEVGCAARGNILHALSEPELKKVRYNAGHARDMYDSPPGVLSEDP